MRVWLHPYICMYSYCVYQYIKHLYMAVYTVSWWIRKLSCIEEVPRFFFFIQFKIQ
jgi:hypothetical protein